MKIILLLILLANVIFGDDISITASVDKDIVEINDEILLQVTVSGNTSSLPSLVLPEISDFNIYSRGQSQSQNFSFVNGRISSSVSIIYNYTLTPKGIGKFVIPSFSVEYKGKIYKTNPINIEVVKSSTQQRQTKPSKITKYTSNEDVFITVTLNKDKVYVNEPVIMSFRLYTRIGFLRQPQYKPPEITGFWIEDLPPQRNFKEIINGKEYMVTEIKTALFPLSPGEYTIGKAYVNCVIDDFSFDDFRDDFFKGIFSRGKNITLESKPVNINVLPLPLPKPSDFSGAVGVFDIKAEVDKKELKTNEPVTLTITISGSGNIKSITEPVISLSENEFKKYETVSSLNINKDNYKVTGSKVFKTVLVPKKAGKLIIPSVKYSFFDYIEKKYKVSSSSPIELLVKQGPKEETLISVGTLSPEGVKILGKDIRYIKQKNKFTFEKPLLYKNFIFVVINLSLPIGLLITWQVISYNKRRKKDERSLRASKAYSKAIKKLKNIYKLINTNKLDESYATLESVLTEYIADKLGKGQHGLTKEEIRQSLLNKVEESLINDINSLIEQIHFIRFAPSNDTQTNLEKLIKSIQETISKLEKVL